MDETRYDQSGATLGDVKLSDFLRKDTGVRVVGVLTPVMASTTSRTRIGDEELSIGRDPSSGMVMPDDSVSRKHARIFQKRSEFVLEDLGSSNGTYVDGVPIVSCVLHSGDSVQFGRNLFLFDRLLQHVRKEDAPNE